MSAVKPFQISVPDSELEKLKTKLSQASFPQDVEFSDSWDFGVPLKDIKRLASYWQNAFDWRAAEARLNAELPQFTTTIVIDDNFGDIELHFVHQRSDRPDSIPLLFCHGWPGSFLEVSKILPLLVKPSSADQPSFHVVAPSLPNYGFSEKITRPGFGPAQYAHVCHKLMIQLGYDKYVTQGGDWGYSITRSMGIHYPQHVLASHVNFVSVTTPPKLTASPAQYLKHAVLPYSKAEKEGLERTQWFMQRGFGYNHEQSTRPHTIGMALADSPIALLAWIYEKLHDWTDDYPWTDDEVLTWISIYAFSTAGPDASVRIYYENRRNLPVQARSGYVPGVLLGLSYFPKDLVVPPNTWGRTLGPVVFEKRHEDGGHFAAFERPEKLVEDLRTMFGQGGGASSVVKKIKNQARM
ncbi:alpha/beta-hydrolase [Cryphonectria parasitica EP155]|uniref:Alpha/beta-hydrolase n=1 Tax=Cryphonectria parasitica (strain ATCC 38755 / EP155) TaxID=660469 RepID=A0A9P4Y7D2_CRYP1|nr:alpha/beta-hydrolase [Cryphonectria parasitica EP155]KAF3768088.1 alpha/beta-hydrolase [Cryphonectria parasitica EP155]